MTQHDLPAAYQGHGWSPRLASLQEEIMAGQLWSPYRNDSEYQRLSAVLIAPPSPSLDSPSHPNDALHLEHVDYAAVHRELHNIASRFCELGVRVHFLENAADHRPASGPAGLLHNRMFTRDQFFMTGEGAIVSRMASTTRAGEERDTSYSLATLGVPILRTISDTATFEGADALWVTPQHVIVGVGNRTTLMGFRQVATCLNESKVDATEVPLPPGVQHLLGIIQIVDRDLAIARGDLLDRRTREFLHRNGISLVELPETLEISQSQAMNFVTIAPRTVVLPSDVPETRALLERVGVTVACQVQITELRKAAGGLACAVGILAREPAIPSSNAPSSSSLA